MRGTAETLGLIRRSLVGRGAAVLAAIVAVTGLPGHAQTLRDALDPFVGQIIDEDEAKVFEGAVAACLLHVSGEAGIQDWFSRTSWDGGIDEGEMLGFHDRSTFVGFWPSPDFCMVESQAIGSEQGSAITGRLVWLLALAPETVNGTDDYGCETITWHGIRATITGEGQDPQCHSETGAAVRLERLEPLMQPAKG